MSTDNSTDKALKTTPILALAPYLGRHWQSIFPSLLAILVASALHALTIFGFPFLNRTIFDTLLPTLDNTMLARLALTIMILVVFNTLFKFLLDAQTAHLRTKLMGILRAEALDSISAMEYAKIKNLERGRAVQLLIAEVDTVADGLTAFCRSAAGVLQLAIVIVVLLAIHISLIWFILAIVGLYSLFTFGFRKTSNSLNAVANEATGKLYSLLFESFGAIKSIKCENLQGVQLAGVAGVQERIGAYKLRASLFEYYSRLGHIIPGRIAFLFLVCFGFYQVRAGAYSIGMFATLFWFTDIVLEASVRLRDSLHSLLSAATSATRLGVLLDERKEPGEKAELREIRSGLECCSLSFSHGGGAKVLSDVNISIPVGRKIGIVGSSGSGKSTLIDLIAGLYRPDHGRILVDGSDIGQYTLSSRRRQIGFVSQDVFLFNDTLRRNIDLLGAHPDSRIIETCRLVCIEDLLERLPEGLDTIVGESGMKLSGGERQRISIARTLMAGARILVLDEGTSALDPSSEIRLLKNLSEIRTPSGPLTLLLITHRKSVAQQLDRIFVLSAGRLADSGTYGELVAKEGPFTRIFGTGEWANAVNG